METPSLLERVDDTTPFVAFDTETTGIWAPANRIVEIGAVRFDLSGQVLAEFRQLVNPERTIPPEVIRIHGITDDMVAARPTVASVLNRFVEFIGADSILVAHNAPFDIAFIGCELERTGIAFGENLILDSVDICRRLFPESASFSLLSLARYLGIAETQEHRALGDARLVMHLLLTARRALGDVLVDSFRSSRFAIFRMSDWKRDTESLPEGFTDLHDAMRRGARVEITYERPSRPTTVRIIRPLAVHVLKEKYYLNAFCELADAERTFRLDRISEYRVLT